MAGTETSTDVEWYHTLELPTGVTPGFFDCRQAARDVPWPDLTGKRCLDIATFDGFWAYEMERRGAAEVVALDIASTREVDWLPRQRDRRTDEPTGAGFRAASAALGSKVQRVLGNVYTLDPEELGTFDVVFLGALLVHLRSPFAAVERITEVCRGTFVSVEPVEPYTSLLLRKRAVLAMAGGNRWMWTTPNTAGHRRLIEIAGFDVEEQRMTTLVYGDGAPAAERRRLSSVRHRAGMRALGCPTDPGLPTSVVVAHPAAQLDGLPGHGAAPAER